MQGPGLMGCMIYAGKRGGGGVGGWLGWGVGGGGGKD